ncbi:MAG: hypothetical protein MZV63_35315 [Marinilabiliales bacterium]|nr:hypothetical protein [Marinilabiliales bacterium]
MNENAALKNTVEKMQACGGRSGTQRTGSRRRHCRQLPYLLRCPGEDSR